MYFKMKVSFGCTKYISVFVLIWLMSFNATVKNQSFTSLFFVSCCILHKTRENWWVSVHTLCFGFSWYNLGRNIISHTLQMIVWVFSALCIGGQMFLFQTHWKRALLTIFFPVICDLLTKVLPSRGQEGMDLCFAAPPGELGLSFVARTHILHP